MAASITINGVVLSDKMPTEPGVYLCALSRTSGQLYIAVVTKVQGGLWATRLGFDSVAYPIKVNPDRRSQFFRSTWWAPRDA